MALASACPTIVLCYIHCQPTENGMWVSFLKAREHYQCRAVAKPLDTGALHVRRFVALA
jgi:hypothetical protein